MSQRPKSVGVFTTDRALVVQSWDPWLATATGIAESTACGRPLAELFPELLERGLLSRLRRVADEGSVEVLSAAFHKYFLPCPPMEPRSPFARMRQHVTLTPLLHVGSAVDGVVVTIEDVTPRVQHEHELARELESHDEEVRLRAAQKMATASDGTSGLADALADRSWRVRRAAAHGIARAGGQQAVDILIEALRERHRDASVLNSALTALARSKEDVVGAVIGLLTLDDAAVRTYAALALGLLEDSRAVPPLVELLEDPDVNVRYHAIEALGRIGDSSASGHLARIAHLCDFFLSFAALDALAAVGDASVAPGLLPLLDHDQLRDPAASCIGAIGGIDVGEPLARMINPKFPDVAIVARTLAAMNARLAPPESSGRAVAAVVSQTVRPEAVRLLTQRLATANDADAESIAVVLGWLKGDGIDAALADLLRREALRERLGEILWRRGPQALDAIVNALRAGDAGTRQVCAVALGRIGSDRALVDLVRLLAAEPEVAIAAAGALAAIGDQRAFEPLLAHLGSPHAMLRQAVVSALNSIGHRDMEWAVGSRLADPDARVRESAARIAGYFGYRSALAPLLALADDENEAVRRAAIEHLANFEDEQAEAAIHRALASDRAVSVRTGAVRALGQIDSEAATEALLRACGDGNLWVRYFAVRTIAHRVPGDARTVGVVLELAHGDPTPPVRIAAIEALAELGVTQAANAVAALTSDPEVEVARAAILALGRIGDDTQAATLTAAMNEGDRARTVAALDSIGRLRLGAAVEDVRTVASEADDLDLRVRAIGTLAEIGSQDAVAAMLRLSRVGRLRGAVHSALRTLGVGS